MSAGPDAKVLRDGLAWFVRLRWIAGGSILLGAVLLRGMLDSVRPALFTAIGILAYNAVFQWGLTSGKWKSKSAAHCQIVLDWAALTFLAYLSGGAASPLIAFYIFHVIIVSVLLDPPEYLAQTTLAVGVVLWLGRHPDSSTAIPWQDWSVEFLNLNIPLSYLVILFTFYTVSYLSGRMGQLLKNREIELEAANRQLEHNDREKTRFLLTAAHSLKSPLSTVESLIVSLLHTDSASFTGDTRTVLERSVHRLQSLSHIVKDLLDLASAREQKMDLAEPFPLGEAALQSIEKLKTVAAAKNIRVNLDAPEHGALIHGIREDWQRVFDNLIENAVKYSPLNSEVEVTITDDTETAECFVQDHGIGIPEKELPRVFDEFYRAANARSYSENGTGLGLSIVRQIVLKHRGSVEAVSVPGEGTTFCVTVPVAQNAGDKDFVSAKTFELQNAGR